VKFISLFVLFFLLGGCMTTKNVGYESETKSTWIADSKWFLGFVWTTTYRCEAGEKHPICYEAKKIPIETDKAPQGTKTRKTLF